MKKITNDISVKIIGNNKNDFDLINDFINYQKYYIF